MSKKRDTAALSDRADRERRVMALVAESHHGGAESKRVLAEVVADLRYELDQILARRLEGTATMDETRIIPGLVAQITKAVAQLGLSLELKLDGRAINLAEDDGGRI